MLKIAQSVVVLGVFLLFGLASEAKATPPSVTVTSVTSNGVDNWTANFTIANATGATRCYVDVIMDNGGASAVVTAQGVAPNGTYSRDLSAVKGQFSGAAHVIVTVMDSNSNVIVKSVATTVSAVTVQ